MPRGPSVPHRLEMPREGAGRLRARQLPVHHRTVAGGAGKRPGAVGDRGRIAWNT